MANQFTRLLKGITMVALVAFVAACARTPDAGVGNLGPGQAQPGTPQEFLVAVGDRVFFETDSSVLTAEARATLDKQAVWLQKHSQYRILIEGHADERGHTRIQHCVGCASGQCCSQLSGEPGRKLNAHYHQEFR